MGLFDRKYCDICGEKISLLGNRKLEDGNMCSSCAKLISPFMTDRRKTTVSDMHEHMTYRQFNRQKLKGFNISQVFGDSEKIYIDSANRNFIVSFYSQESWEKENPDVIPMSELVSCNLEVKENRHEEFTKDAQGNRKSYSPPRYTYDYDFYIHITVSNRWFNEIDVKLNSFDVEGLNSQRYHNYEMTAQQIISALTCNNTNYSIGTGYGIGAGIAGGAASAFSNQSQQSAYDMSTVKQTTELIKKSKEQALEKMQTQGIPDVVKRICPNCQTTAESSFCPNCGNEMANPLQIVCRGCGKALEMKGIIPKFCPDCGHKFDTEDF